MNTIADFKRELMAGRTCTLIDAQIKDENGWRPWEHRSMGKVRKTVGLKPGSRFPRWDDGVYGVSFAPIKFWSFDGDKAEWREEGDGYGTLLVYRLGKETE